MTRAQLLAMGIGIALVAILASPAAAQEDPTLTVDPSEVDAAGEVDFTISGENWTAEPPILILTCPFPSSGELADIDLESCDTEDLTPATPVDGAFSIPVTYDVPAEGLAIIAADTGQTVAIPALVTVAAAQEDPPEGGDDSAGDDGADSAGDDSAATDGEGEDAGDEGLADTGVESGLIAIVAAALLGAGAMVIATTRRFNLR